MFNYQKDLDNLFKVYRLACLDKDSDLMIYARREIIEKCRELRMSDVKDAFEREGKLHAVKLYKFISGCSLMEAKTYVESTAKEENWKEFE